MTPLHPSVFSNKKRIYRYIPEEYRASGGRVSPGAFLLSDQDTERADAHLSVNILSPEETKDNVNDIIQYYDEVVSKDDDVAYVDIKLQELREKAKNNGYILMFDSSEKYFWFEDNSDKASDLKHRPTKVSRSHTGIEFIRSQGYLKQKRFAQELAKRRKFHQAS